MEPRLKMLASFIQTDAQITLFVVPRNISELSSVSSVKCQCGREIHGINGIVDAKILMRFVPKNVHVMARERGIRLLCEVMLLSRTAFRFGYIDDAKKGDKRRAPFSNKTHQLSSPMQP